MAFGSALIGNLAVTLGLNTAAFELGAAKAKGSVAALESRLTGFKKSITGLGAGLVAGGLVVGLTSLAKNAFDVAAAMDESAQKMGVSVEAFQRLNLAAEQNGVSQEAFASSMAKLNKSIGLLAEGSPQAAKAFDKIGLSFDDLKGKAPEVQLGIIADALNKLPTVQERIAVGASIMGKGFSQLLPLINQGSAGLEHYSQVSQKQGEITTEEAKRLDELSDSWDRLKVRVGVFLAKLIATGAEFVQKSDEWLANWYKFRDGVVAATEEMARGAISNIQKMVEGIASHMKSRLHQVLEDTKSDIHTVTNAFATMYDKVVGHSYVPDMVDEIGRSIGELQHIMVDPALSATQKVGAAFQALAGTVSSLFGRKTGGIIASVMNLVGVVAPLFGGTKIGSPNLGAPLPVSLGSPQPMTGLVPGFARGGGGTFGGFPGMDKNVLALNGSPIARVSKGEHFSVSRKAANQNFFDLRGAVMTEDLLAQMNNIGEVAMTKGAVFGAAGAEERGVRRARRTIP